MANIKQCSDRNALRFTLLSFSVMACFALLAVPAGAQHSIRIGLRKCVIAHLAARQSRRRDRWRARQSHGGLRWRRFRRNLQDHRRRPAWTPIFDKEEVMSIGALAIAPSAHNIVWAGTGEPFYNRVATSIGNGIYKSTDGGANWKHMGLENTGRIARIVVDPTNPDIVFAAAVGSGFAPSQDRGVFRTTDGGKTWQRVLLLTKTRARRTSPWIHTTRKHCLRALGNLRFIPGTYTAAVPAAASSYRMMVAPRGHVSSGTDFRRIPSAKRQSPSRRVTANACTRWSRISIRVFIVPMMAARAGGW